MATKPLTEHARKTLEQTRWIALGCMALFAVSLLFVVSPTGYLYSAVVVGVAFSIGLIVNWRTGSKYGFAIVFPILFIGLQTSRHYAVPINTPVPFSFEIQWITLVVSVSFGLVALFRKPIIRFCQLDEETNSPPPPGVPR